MELFQLPEIYWVYFVFLCLQEILLFTKRLFVEVMNEMCTEITKEALDKVCELKLIPSDFYSSCRKITI